MNQQHPSTKSLERCSRFWFCWRILSACVLKMKPRWSFTDKDGEKWCDCQMFRSTRVFISSCQLLQGPAKPLLLLHAHGDYMPSESVRRAPVQSVGQNTKILLQKASETISSQECRNCFCIALSVIPPAWSLLQATYGLVVWQWSLRNLQQLHHRHQSLTCLLDAVSWCFTLFQENKVVQHLIPSSKAKALKLGRCSCHDSLPKRHNANYQSFLVPKHCPAPLKHDTTHPVASCAGEYAASPKQALLWSCSSKLVKKHGKQHPIGLIDSYGSTAWFDFKQLVLHC